MSSKRIQKVKVGNVYKTAREAASKILIASNSAEEA
jgi:hypothetical protein